MSEIFSFAPHFLLSLFMARASWKKTFEHCRRIACLFIWGYLCWERRFEGVCLRSSGSLSKHSFRAGWGCHQEMVEHVWSPPDATYVVFSSFQAFDVQLFIIRQFRIFTLCVKSTWSQNWRNCTFIIFYNLIVNYSSGRIWLIFHQTRWKVTNYMFLKIFYLEIHEITGLKPCCVWRFMLTLGIVYTQMKISKNFTQSKIRMSLFLHQIWRNVSQQWMLCSEWVPSEWESDKNITIIHTTPVHQLMSWENKSWNKSIKTFLTKIRVHNP